MPQYNGVWTLQAQAQALTSQQWVTDPQFKNTTLLLQADNLSTAAQNITFLDSGTANGGVGFPITRVGNTTQGSFSPFSQAPGYWSNYISGVNDYVKIASNAAYGVGTGNFTLEGFFNINALGTRKPFTLGSSGSEPIAVTFTTTTIRIDIAGTTNIINVTQTIPLDSWNHIAFVRSGTGAGQVALYLNGSRITTGTSSGSIAASDFQYGGIDWAGTYSLVGNYSNVRYSNTARYSGATYTVPTEPFISDANTLVLTAQSNRFINTSPYGGTVTVSGASVQASSLFAPVLQWTPDVVGGSGYLPASGSYLTLPVNSAFAPGTGDYTVDGWVYTGSNTLQTIWAQTVSGTNYFVIEANAPSSVIQITSAASGGGTAITSAATLRLNAWNHFCISRTSGVITVWCNGSAGTPTANTVNLTNITYIPTIGTYSHATTTNVLIGYLANLRYIKGTALSGATIPTAPNTAVTNTQALLNFTNAGIYDGTMESNLQTVADAQVSTSVVRYGSGSMKFDGTGDYLVTYGGQNFAFGTGDFTVEFWVNVTVNGVFYDSRPTSTDGLYVTIAASDFPSAAGNSVSFVVSGARQITGTAVIRDGLWHHVALCRANRVTKLFVDGVQTGSSYTDTNNYLNGASRPVIGSQGYTLASSIPTGYMDDLRVTKAARYYQDFIPPKVALPRQ